MKHLIRILCLLLCLVMAVGVLAACNDDTDNTPPADDGGTQPPAGDGGGDTTPPAVETYTVRGFSIVGEGNALLTAEYEKNTNKVLKETYMICLIPLVLFTVQLPRLICLTKTVTL